MTKDEKNIIMMAQYIGKLHVETKRANKKMMDDIIIPNRKSAFKNNDEYFEKSQPYRKAIARAQKYEREAARILIHNIKKIYG